MVNLLNGLNKKAFTEQIGDKTSLARKATKMTPLGFAIPMGLETAINTVGGDDLGTAAAKGFVSGALWQTMPGLMTAHLAATTAPQLFGAYEQFKHKQEAWWSQQHRPTFGGNYQDTQRAMTMRQAAVQQIQGSKLNARSALGGEAQILAQNYHRG